MKVKLEITLEVNEKEWAEMYGSSPSEVRGDVKNYFAGTVADQIEHASLPVEITKG